MQFLNSSTLSLVEIPEEKLTGSSARVRVKLFYPRGNHPAQAIVWQGSARTSNGKEELKKRRELSSFSPGFVLLGSLMRLNRGWEMTQFCCSTPRNRCASIRVAEE